MRPIPTTAGSNRSALSLALAAVIVLVAGVLPACACVTPHGCCSTLPETPSIHSTMPCCAVPTLTPTDVARVQPATFPAWVSSPRTWVPVALVARPGSPDLRPPVHAALPNAAAAPPELSPPLFLLNAQFLI